MKSQKFMVVPFKEPQTKILEVVPRKAPRLIFYPVPSFREMVKRAHSGEFGPLPPPGGVYVIDALASSLHGEKDV